MSLRTRWVLKEKPSECLGDIGGSASTQYRDSKISQGGHHAWSVSGADLRAVFAKGFVSQPVQAVFNSPMHAVDCKQVLG